MKPKRSGPNRSRTSCHVGERVHQYPSDPRNKNSLQSVQKGYGTATLADYTDLLSEARHAYLPKAEDSLSMRLFDRAYRHEVCAEEIADTVQWYPVRRAIFVMKIYSSCALCPRY